MNNANINSTITLTFYTTWIMKYTKKAAKTNCDVIKTNYISKGNMLRIPRAKFTITSGRY
jgi:hypothetical protein